jgi:hypothetical protein
MIVFDSCLQHQRDVRGTAARAANRGFRDNIFCLYWGVTVQIVKT